MTDSGYCTAEDVRRVLQDVEFTGALAEDANQAVEDAITAQSEWLQETTNRHWYDPNPADALLYSDPLTHSEDALDVPSSPHSGHTQTPKGSASGGPKPRYPVRMSGPYTRVKLSRRDVTDITELLIRDNSGDYEDWVNDKDEGRGEDYYVQVDDADGWSRLYLHTGSLGRLASYGSAVIATYEYGIEGITDTVRRAVAFRAAAELIIDDEASIGIPDQGQLVNVQTKAEQYREKAAELLEIHV